MDSIFEDIKKTIADELIQFQQFCNEEFKSFEFALDDINQYLINYKGKLLRPIIILLSAKMNGKICKKTYIAAQSMEILHTATLIHDDIVDGAEIRRGIPTIQSQWSPQIAVLVGDYLLAKALDIITKNKLYDVISTATEVVKHLSEGELLQIQKSITMDTTEEDYLKVIYKKTASLICACTRFGAVSVDADESIIEQMTEIGRNIGLAFQIRDDILDFDKENKTGKSYGNDLREHKLTLPLIYALKNSAEHEQKTIIEKLINCTENPQFIDDIIEFTHKHQGIVYAEKKMKDFCKKAIHLLEKFPQSDARDALIMLAEYTTIRKM
ncbi:MAG: polyprenyl synthetase family protein [Prevotellaceae bacterium]|jgi:octaprenyl-diphosphate synthase|nr:polyprenyl synthetase family protein [Prevotellaceae bacterium]